MLEGDIGQIDHRRDRARGQRREREARAEEEGGESFHGTRRRQLDIAIGE